MKAGTVGKRLWAKGDALVWRNGEIECVFRCLSSIFDDARGVNDKTEKERENRATRRHRSEGVGAAARGIEERWAKRDRRVIMGRERAQGEGNAYPANWIGRAEAPE